MYKQILVAIENSAADETIVEHVEALARLTGSRLLLVHVADGWAARNFEELNLRESEEMQRGPRVPRADRGRARRQGLRGGSDPGHGRPGDRDLPHRLRSARWISSRWRRTATAGVSDVIHGQTVDHVRHKVPMPVLLLKAKRIK